MTLKEVILGTSPV